MVSRHGDLLDVTLCTSLKLLLSARIMELYVLAATTDVLAGTVHVSSAYVDMLNLVQENHCHTQESSLTQVHGI
jgi:hypothetical protein